MTDGCVHLLNNSSWKFYQLAAGQLMSGQPVRYGKGRWYGPSISYKITHAGPLSSSQPGGPPCWTSQPSSVRPYWSQPAGGRRGIQMSQQKKRSTSSIIIHNLILYH
ncbi:MAG: hypothetical protein ACK56F_05780, partial [bacterium]